MKDFCVGQASVIFQEPKNLLFRIILIASNAVPISNCLKTESGNARCFSAYKYVKVI